MQLNWDRRVRVALLVHAGSAAILASAAADVNDAIEARNFKENEIAVSWSK